jgi:hypothetical protein
LVVGYMNVSHIILLRRDIKEIESGIL